MAAYATLTREPVTCRDSACAAASSHPDTCRCSCGGDNHGAMFQPARQAAIAAVKARYLTPGFLPGMTLTSDAEEAF